MDSEDDRALRAELDREFVKELAVRLEELDAALERLRRPGERADDVAAADIARDAHSISGGAQLVGRTEIGRLAVAIELHVERRRRGDGELSVPTLTEAVGAIRALGTGADSSEAVIAGLIDRLGRA